MTTKKTPKAGCTCAELDRLREAVRLYMEEDNASEIQKTYLAFSHAVVQKLLRVDEPLSIHDRRRIYTEITRLREKAGER